MKKRLTKVLALGLTAAMIAGAPLSAMAAEAAPTDVSVTSEATDDAQDVTDANAEEANAAESTNGTADVAEAQEVQPEENTGDAETEAADSEEDSADIQNEAQPEIAAQAADDGVAVMALSNGYNPMDLNGLVQLNDGNWYYMENGQVSYNANGTVKPACGSWWYVNGYKIDFSYTGFGSNGDDNWYVENGQVQFGYNGIAVERSEYGYTSTYYVTNGRLDADYTGLAYGIVDGVDGWYNFYEGSLQYGRELVEYNGVWWYIGDGRRVDFSYSGIAYNEAGAWYVRNGQVDFSYNGMIEGWYGYDDKTPYQYFFVNGKLNEGLTGVYYTTVNGIPGWYGFDRGALATYMEYGGGDFYGTVLPNASGWWYIDPDTGMVDFSFHGVARNEFPGDDWYHYWCIENGQVNFNYTGFLTYTNKYDDPYVCYVTNGQVDENVNGVYQITVNGKTDWYGLWRGKQTSGDVLMNPNDGSWWYVGDGGKINFSYTGIATRYDWISDTSDSWYIRNGQVDFSCSGWLEDGNSYYKNYYLIENGRVRDDVSGLMQTTVGGVNAWWNVQQGTIFWTNGGGYPTLVYYNGDWWYVMNGQVDFSYTGFVNYNSTNWYVENGRVNFNKTGFVNFNGYDSYEYVQNGQHDYSFSGLVYAELNGKTAWWAVKNGSCYHYDDAWYDSPNDYMANESGLWAIINGEVAFNVNGVYSMGYGYYMNQDNTYITINYTYEVVNGLVTNMQVAVQ